MTNIYFYVQINRFLFYLLEEYICLYDYLLLRLMCFFQYRTCCCCFIDITGWPLWLLLFHIGTNHLFISNCSTGTYYYVSNDFRNNRPRTNTDMELNANNQYEDLSESRLHLITIPLICHHLQHKWKSINRCVLHWTAVNYYCLN